MKPPPSSLTAPEKRIATMLAAGDITAAQAKELLEAIAPNQQPSAWMLLIHPFERLTGRTSMALTILVFVASLALTPFGIQFDGGVDVHHFDESPTLLLGAAQIASAMLITTLSFWLTCRIAKATPRFIDMLGVISVSRVPLIGMALSSVLMNPTSAQPRPAWLIALLPITMLTVVWMLVLLFRGVRWASGSLVGMRMWFVYLLALVLAEVASLAWIRLVLA